MSGDAGARWDWEQRVHRRVDGSPAAPTTLAAPAPVSADGAVGHVRLSWKPVAGAMGYLIERSEDGARSRVLDHGGADVPAVPGPPFADTSVNEGQTYRYRVGAVAAAGSRPAAWSDWVSAGPAAGEPGPVVVHVDARRVTGRLQRVWRMVGSERLSQLNAGEDGHGNHIGAEFAEALRLAHDDLGVEQARAHAILHDELGVARRGPDGRVQHDFSAIDAIYDQILSIGIRPVVELSFMPAALARDPEQTVFAYRGIISPPSSWEEWHDLVAALAGHLVERYGVDEVRRWGFEVWNEPNLEVFWSGTQDEYRRLYEEAARAVKSVDGGLPVGGPSTSAGEWVEAMASHASAAALPLDFLSTHTYGNLPVDVRPALDRHGLTETQVWWTEWGVGHSHFGPVHDAVIGAPFMLSGYAAAQHRLDALAYWVISDHFEELGRPPRLLHDGFGLLTVGNLRKPRYWAAHLAAHQGDEVLDSRVEGDGAEVLIESWATRHDDGSVDVLVWNGTNNAELLGGAPRLHRSVEVHVRGLPERCYTAHLARVDEHHSNVVTHCPPEVDWPDAELWAHLRAADVLDERRLPDVTATDATAAFTLGLPMPGVARIRLRPDRNSSTTFTPGGNDT